MSLILASASPRRQELLRQMGLKFSTITSTVMEDTTQLLPPHELAVSLAKAKALDVKEHVHKGLVLGADTIVVLDGNIYGKPRNSEEARTMLLHLSGNTHQVITGIALVDSQKDMMWTDYAVTNVKMACLDPALIDNYIATGEPLDKAGAYAIQGKGAILVESIQGCYSNVVGLSIPLVHLLLKKAGYQTL